MKVKSFSTSYTMTSTLHSFAGRLETRRWALPLDWDQVGASKGQTIPRNVNVMLAN